MKLTLRQQITSVLVFAPFIPLSIILFAAREACYIMSDVWYVIGRELERFDIFLGKYYARFNKSVIQKYF